MRFIDSAGQHYTTATSGLQNFIISRKWTLQSVTVTTGGRRGSPYLLGNNALKTLTQTSNWVLGGAFIAPVGSGTFLTLQNNTQDIVKLHINSDSTLSVGLSGTNLFTSASPITDVSTWHYYEMKCNLTGGTGVGSVLGTVWVDGDQLGTFTGACGLAGTNLINGSFTANMAGFASNVSVGMMDFYAFDDATTDMNGNTTTLTTHIGDVQVDAIFPAADISTGWGTGAGGDGTHAYSCVNETSPDDDTSYLTTTSTTAHEAFTYQPISTFTGTFFGAQYLVCMKKDAEGSREFAMTVGSATISSINFLGTANYLSDYYVYYIAPLDTNNGTAWTTVNFDAQNFGVTLLV